MTENIKKRLIGAAVLASLAVIFIPMLLEEETVIDSNIYSTNIPERIETVTPAPQIQTEQLDRIREEHDYGTSIQPSKDAEVKDIASSSTDSSTISVADEKPVTTRTGLSSWMIQVGSFSSQDNANKIVSQLREAGYDTHLETAQVKSRKVFRVRVGPEIDRNNADRIAKEVSKKFFVKAKVLRYP
jgi:DedD protein